MLFNKSKHSVYARGPLAISLYNFIYIILYNNIDISPIKVQVAAAPLVRKTGENTDLYPLIFKKIVYEKKKLPRRGPPDFGLMSRPNLKKRLAIFQKYCKLLCRKLTTFYINL